jgi:hypothetical protein
LEFNNIILDKKLSNKFKNGYFFQANLPCKSLNFMAPAPGYPSKKSQNHGNREKFE